MRSELRRFANRMERKLAENDHKDHWSHYENGHLLRRLGQELGELRRAMKRGDTTSRIADEAADVANFAMMIADNALDRAEASGGTTGAANNG